MLHSCAEHGAFVAVATVVGIDFVANLCDAHYFGHDIGCGPWGASGAGVWFVAGDSPGRTYGVAFFDIAADKARFFYLTGNP